MPKAKAAKTGKASGQAKKIKTTRQIELAAASNGAGRPEVKELAGVRVPKELRGIAASAQRLMENPLVADVVTAGIIAAAAALAETQAAKGAARAVGNEAQNAKRSANAARTVAKAAAIAMGKKLFDEVKASGALDGRRGRKKSGDGGEGGLGTI